MGLGKEVHKKRTRKPINRKPKPKELQDERRASYLARMKRYYQAWIRENRAVFITTADGRVITLQEYVAERAIAVSDNTAYRQP